MDLDAVILYSALRNTVAESKEKMKVSVFAPVTSRGSFLPKTLSARCQFGRQRALGSFVLFWDYMTGVSTATVLRMSVSSPPKTIMLALLVFSTVDS